MDIATKPRCTKRRTTIVAHKVPVADAAQTFDWPLAYEAEQFLRRHVRAFLDRNSFARRLMADMRDQTGTDFFEWIDHLVLSAAEESGFAGQRLRP